MKSTMMRKILKSLTRTALAVSLLFVANISIAQAGNSGVTRVVTPFQNTFYLSCANSGLGENVNVSGSFVLTMHSVPDGAGNYHFQQHINVRYVGAGEVTGDSYVGGVEFSNTFTSLGATGESSTISNSRVVGKGAVFFIKGTYHVTINAIGDVTASVSSMQAECH